MPVYKRKGSRFFYYRFEVDKQEYRRSTGETDRRKAEAFERAKRAGVESRPRAVHGKGKGLADVAGLETERQAAVGIGGTTVTGMYDVHWRHITKFFGADTHPNSITDRMISQYVIWRKTKCGVSGQTVRRELTTLKRGLKMAKAEGWSHQVPEKWPVVRSAPKSAHAGKLHPPEVIAQFLGRLSQRLRDEVVFALLTGLRWAEVKRVRPEWIVPAPPGSPTPAILRMPGPATKSKYARDIGLSHEAMAIVKRCVERGLIEGTLFGAGDRSASYNRARIAMGYNKTITLRDMRHLYGTMAMAAGADVVSVMRAMGHRDYKTAELYQHTTLQRASEASAAVSKALTGTVVSAHMTIVKKGDK